MYRNVKSNELLQEDFCKNVTNFHLLTEKLLHRPKVIRNKVFKFFFKSESLRVSLPALDIAKHTANVTKARIKKHSDIKRTLSALLV